MRLECACLSGLWEATEVDLLFLETLSAAVLLEPTPSLDFAIILLEPTRFPDFAVVLLEPTPFPDFALVF